MLKSSNNLLLPPRFANKLNSFLRVSVNASEKCQSNNNAVTIPCQFSEISTSLIKCDQLTSKAIYKTTMASENETSSNQLIGSRTDQLAEMMKNMSEDEPKMIDIRTVHAMFKKLQEDFDECLRQVEERRPAVMETDGTSNIQDLATQMESLSIKRKVMTGAV